jgi:hypothetical protein
VFIRYREFIINIACSPIILALLFRGIYFLRINIRVKGLSRDRGYSKIHD